MAVPNTTTFSLQDVQTELGGVNDDLVECFANASASGFDPVYEGLKNSLLNFRNYNNNINAVSFVDSFGTVSVGTTLNATISASVISGDLLVIMLFTEPYVNVLTPPTGWTLEFSATGSNQPRLWCYTKIAGVSDASSVVSIGVDSFGKDKRIFGVAARNQGTTFKGNGWNIVDVAGVSTSWSPALTVSAGSLVVCAVVVTGTTSITYTASETLTPAGGQVQQATQASRAECYVDMDGGTDSFTLVTYNTGFRKGYIFEITT